MGADRTDGGTAIQAALCLLDVNLSDDLNKMTALWHACKSNLPLAIVIHLAKLSSLETVNKKAVYYFLDVVVFLILRGPYSLTIFDTSNIE